MTIWFFEIHLSEKAVAVVVLPYTFKKPGTKHLTENSSQDTEQGSITES